MFKSDKYGKFFMKRMIGNGKQSIVYLIKTEEGKHLMVLKKFMQYSYHQNEVKFLKILDHENIIKVNDYNITQNNKLLNAFLMPYYPFGTLCSNSYIINESFNDIWKALDYTHSNNIIHRDVKPQNIMCDNNNKLILSDFGLSIDKSNIVGRAGSLLYVSPEVLKSEKYNEKCDIWSAGVTYLTLLKNEHFVSNIQDIIIKHGWKGLENSNTWNNFSDYSKNILKGTLCVNMNDRASANELII